MYPPGACTLFESFQFIQVNLNIKFVLRSKVLFPERIVFSLIVFISRTKHTISMRLLLNSTIRRFELPLETIMATVGPLSELLK